MRVCASGSEFGTGGMKNGLLFMPFFGEAPEKMAEAPASFPDFLGEEDGQMVVEVAVLMPAMLVVAVVVVNLMWFLEAASLFERVVPDAVIAAAVSPAGENAGSSQEHRVAEAIEQAMGGVRGVQVSVRAESAWESGEGLLGLSFAPHLTRYVCTMTYTPWPAGFAVAGFDASIPLVLERQRSFTVDRYRPGVLF